MTDIERLAKEAGAMTIQTQGIGDGWFFSDMQLAKFAALIAEECADNCQTQIDADNIPALFPMPK